MTSPTDRRHDLTERMADFVLAHGLAAATLRPLAASAGVSDRMLLYYFTDKPAAVTAAFDCLLRRLATALSACAQTKPVPLGRLRSRAIRLLLADDLWPYMQLWLDVSADAARGDPVQRSRGQAIWKLCLDWVQPQLISDSPNEATRLLHMIEAAVLTRALGLNDPTD